MIDDFCYRNDQMALLSPRQQDQPLIVCLLADVILQPSLEALALVSINPTQ
ncbi:MAG: hypothetical protein U5L46_11325 [Agrobacterium sp.]|nr:hypothetical protein [Agrobacterium sp.]